MELCRCEYWQIIAVRMDIRRMCFWDLKEGGNTVAIFPEYLLAVCFRAIFIIRTSCFIR